MSVRSNDRRKPAFNAADSTLRELLLFGLLPILVGGGLLCWAYFLHLQRLHAPAGDGLITFLNVVGGGMCLIAGMISAAILLAKLIRLVFRSNATSTHNAALLLSFALVLAVFFRTLGAIDNRYRSRATAALDKRGVARSFLIESRTWRGTRYPHFELRIRVPDERGTLHELLVDYPARLPVDELDSVAIRYLPANPTIFRSLEPQ